MSCHLKGKPALDLCGKGVQAEGTASVTALRRRHTNRCFQHGVTRAVMGDPEVALMGEGRGQASGNRQLGFR